MDDISVRPFAAHDREAVRSICWLTGYIGEPADWMWRDRESFADLFSGYYTDHEPRSALVAESSEGVVGYLLGCRDSRDATNIGQVLGHHVVRRGLLLRPGTAPFLWRILRDLAVDGMRHRLPHPNRFDQRWPAHLHIDLLPEARGRGVGSMLMRRWLDTLRTEGVAGCHLETMAENHSAIAFFQRCGFERRGAPQLVPGMRSPEGARHHVQLMTLAFRDGDTPASGT